MNEFFKKHNVKFIIGIIISIAGAIFAVGGLYSSFTNMEKTVENNVASIDTLEENTTIIKTNVEWIRVTLDEIKDDIK